MFTECVTLLGIASIQDYVFRSNRLKENLGASWIVEKVLSKLPSDQVLYIGGGNAGFIFPTKDDARSAVRHWSLHLLQNYPGLRVAVVHEPRHPAESLAKTVERARKGLMQAENLPPFGSEMGALPVVRECASTGLAASARRDQAWLSAEAFAKREAAEKATPELRQRYKEALGSKFTFPVELDKLGTEKGASQIAIVHADGDGVGKLIRQLTESIDNDNEFREKIRAVSKAITDIAQTAMQETLKDLAAVLPKLENEGVIPAKCEDEVLRETSAQYYFPVRPIVDSGDDLTFVCHGKLGLSLAARYLDHFENVARHHVDLLQQQLTSSAGVLIMPQKFPFARGYRLAEALSAGAKQSRRLESSSESWIDFQVLLEGSPGSLDALRAGYRFSDSGGDVDLLRRPYCLRDHPVRGWPSFEEIWTEFHRTWPRNRAKRLLGALARGRDETRSLLTQFKARKIELALAGANRDTFEQTVIAHTADGKGVYAFTTPYFDALEVLDFHIEWPS